MEFSSITFLIFFLITAGLLWLTDAEIFGAKATDEKRRTARHIIMLVASYIFYGWWDWRFCFLMAGLSLIAYFCAKKIDENKNKKLMSAIGVVVPLIVLGIFKYFNFFVDSFTDLFGIENSLSLNIILPVGISFYTFQSMSYTIDVIRGKVKSHSLLKVALYVSFFPQLVAGPIVKAADFIPQLDENRNINWKNIEKGIQIFAMGLFKKIVIADNLSVFVDDVFDKPEAFSSLSVIFSVIAYSIQIYCDFSGYSDMAIGSAKCLGYDFKPNFNMPYISKNVSEFWKRWHISLSSWLQEYLYIPLGGNRKGKARTYINLLLTMVLGGLWHGASWNFVLWGALNGLALCTHKLFKAKRGEKKSIVIGSAVSVLLTYIFTCICWVFFRADDMTTAFAVFKKMFVFSDGINQTFAWAVFAVIVVVGATIVAALKAKKSGEKTVNGFYPSMSLEKIPSLIILITFIGITLGLAYTGSNPFIYFQF